MVEKIILGSSDNEELKSISLGDIMIITVKQDVQHIDDTIPDGACLELTMYCNFLNYGRLNLFWTLN